MFAKGIVQSARFLKMPLTSQALYFHLGVCADDDGIVEAFPVMRMISAAEDDIRVLVSKGYITILNEDLVAYMNDWNSNNVIRADRYHKSIYHDLLIKINDLSDKGLNEISTISQMTTKCQPSDNQMTTNGLPRLGKVSIGKDSKGKDSIERARENHKKQEPIVYFPDEKLNQTFLDYIAMRNKIKKPLTDHAIDLVIKKLIDLATIPFSDGVVDPDMEIKILEQSIMNSWQGLFPLKSDKQQSGKNIDWSKV